MVMPAELLQVSYAAPIREYLLTQFGFIFVVTFGRLVFPEVEQEVVLLMGTKKEGKGLRLIELKDDSDLDLIHKFRAPQVPVEDSSEKWTQYFLNDAQRKVLRDALRSPNIRRLGEMASVDIGVVTGYNDFFILREDAVKQLNAEEHTVPVVTRTKALSGIRFCKGDWRENRSNGLPTYLLTVNSLSGIPSLLRQYIKKGEKEGISKHFKCRIRDPWYVVPSVWVPHAFLFRQIGVFPKLILNEMRATCTDTLHRVKFKNIGQSKAIAACFYNSLTFACAEIFGRSYGGGVLELMPTEAEKLPIPFVSSEPHELFFELDSLMRQGLVDEALDLGDKRILRETLGFSDEGISIMRTAWRTLSDRRGARRAR